MKIAFFSNYLSPHQIPFSDEMYRLIGNDFSFVSCEPFSMSRKQMGWNEDEKRTYELRPYESREDYIKALELTEKSDIMIWGSAKLEFVKARIKSGKINVRYSERLFKKGFISSIKTFDILRQIKFNLVTRSQNSFLLCASAYSPFDFLYSFGHFRETYKWGYYPKTIYYNLAELMNKKSNTEDVSLLWAGRMIPLKHPEIVVDLAEKLREKDVKFSIKMIGSGELETQIRSSISNKHLSDKIVMLGSMSPSEVRKHMEASDFFLFTSDFQEGWGAVLNESMNSGCIVICSDEVGAAHYLIEDEKNGFLFQRNQLDKLADKVIDLASNPTKRRKIGSKAYESISNLWSSQIAAARFYEWSEYVVKNEIISFDEGPMSTAKVKLPKGSWWIR